jgi:hypothetical protein
MTTYQPLITKDGRVERLDDPDGLAIAHVADVDYIDFDTTPNVAGAIGRLKWNNDDGTLEAGMLGGEVTLQIGQEQLMRVTNNTANTILNGTPVYTTGTSGYYRTIAPGDAVAIQSAFVYGIATENISTNSEGYICLDGLVRGVDTSTYNEGDPIYLAQGGGITPTAPDWPNYKCYLGRVLTVNGSDGVISVEIDMNPWLAILSDTVVAGAVDGSVLTYNSTQNAWLAGRGTAPFFNGSFKEHIDAFVTSPDSVNIVFSLEQSGGGDLTMQFDDGETILDCTPAQTINLTPGTDTSPAGTMVYIPFSTKTLTSGSTWPSEEHIRVAYVALPSASFVNTYGGPYVNQNWNDHLRGVDKQGHMTHITKKIRLGMGATWYSGINPDGDDDSYFTMNTGNVYWKSTSGVISQLHDQTFSAKDTSVNNVILVANDPDAAYTVIDNLFTGITDDSTGNTIGNNKYFSLIFWGVQNKTDQGSGVVVNLPAGSYTNIDSALVDLSSYDDYNFAREFSIDSGVAFLICRATFRMGTTGWTWVQTDDLRGKVPSNIAGGGGGGVTDHGALSGLADDDHTQYALVDGTRAFTGNITVPSIETTASQNMVITHSSTNVFVVNTGNNLNFGTSYAASVIIGGENQTLNATHSVMLGGNTNNIRDGVIESAIIGGTGHVLRTQDKQAIIGGRDGTANGFCSIIAGGRANGTRGSYSGAFAGWGNTANGEGAISVGGKDQTCCATYSATISSLSGNVQGNYSAIVAGQSCTIEGSTNNSVILGSYNSTIKTSDSTIIAGQSNTANGDGSAAIAGQTQTCNGDYSVAAGSLNSFVEADYSVIIGGKNNSISADSVNSAIIGASLSSINNSLYGVIAGTFNSETENNASVILGGFHHRSDGVSTAIVGGQTHTIENHYSFIGGGVQNTSNGGSSAMCGGQDNDLTGDYSAIIAGRDNTTTNSFAAIIGGRYNEVSGQYGIAHGRYADSPHYAGQAQSGGSFNSTAGETQIMRLHMGGSQTSGASVDLTLDSTTNGQALVIPAKTLWYVRATVVAYSLAANQSAAYRVYSAVSRGATGNAAFVTTGALPTNPYVLEDASSHPANFSLTGVIRTGNVVTFNATYTGSARWSAMVDITQIRID